MMMRTMRRGIYAALRSITPTPRLSLTTLLLIYAAALAITVPTYVCSLESPPWNFKKK